MDLEPRTLLELLSDLARDCANGWSIGSFGAIGEFTRAEPEPATFDLSAERLEVVTARGGIRIAPDSPLRAIAYDTLSSDGEGWSHALALCAPRTRQPRDKIVSLGPDLDALDANEHGAELFDLGVAAGCVRMCVRTRDESLSRTLAASVDGELLSNRELIGGILATQPHRVLLSPAGRIEVYQPIPSAEETSPLGPHTHLLPKLISTRRTHSSNVPVPEGWQPVLTVHPRSPWPDEDNAPVPYDESADAAFAPFLDRFGLAEDKEIRDSIIRAVNSGEDASAFAWPSTRRGRTAARITLRRLAAARTPAVASWRAIRDNTPVDPEADLDGSRH
jgi:hypothetical protein